MAKSNRLIKTTLVGGGRLAQVVSIGAIIKGMPSTVIPDGYVQDKEKVQEGKHCIVSEFAFKAKLRLIPTEDPDVKNIETGEPGTVEDEMLDFVIDYFIKEGYSISFEGQHKPTRMDFQHRLECRGFIRDKKSKECTYGLIKL